MPCSRGVGDQACRSPRSCRGRCAPRRGRPLIADRPGAPGSSGPAIERVVAALAVRRPIGWIGGRYKTSKPSSARCGSCARRPASRPTNGGTARTRRRNARAARSTSSASGAEGDRAVASGSRPLARARRARAERDVVLGRLGDLLVAECARGRARSAPCRAGPLTAAVAPRGGARRPPASSRAARLAGRDLARELVAPGGERRSRPRSVLPAASASTSNDAGPATPPRGASIRRSGDSRQRGRPRL